MVCAEEVEPIASPPKFSDAGNARNVGGRITVTLMEGETALFPEASDAEAVSTWLPRDAVLVSQVTV